jgi:hypothetical protein
LSLTVWDGLTVGAVGGFLSGITVWFSQLIKKRLIEGIHKKRVYACLFKKTKKVKGLTVGSLINAPDGFQKRK